MNDYDKIAAAITYIQTNFTRQPSLEEIAGSVHLSPFHFQRLFRHWAGVTPKKFIQYLTLGYAKRMLKESRSSLSDTAFASGLSGTSRLHDLFVGIEAMTPAEYKHGGAALQINYQFAESYFGPVLVGSTDRGICHLSFIMDPGEAFKEFQADFPKAWYQEKPDRFQNEAISILASGFRKPTQILLHLKASPFQIKVWEALLRIPYGRISTYGDIAREIGLAGASRAVGRAIGANQVAVLIPCHRVIRADGNFGDYHWGSTRKMALIGLEATVKENKKSAHPVSIHSL